MIPAPPYPEQAEEWDEPTEGATPMGDDKDWKRIANEWASELYDALARFKAINDGSLAPSEAIAATERALARCRALATPHVTPIIPV